MSQPFVSRAQVIHCTVANASSFTSAVIDVGTGVTLSTHRGGWVAAGKTMGQVRGYWCAAESQSPGMLLVHFFRRHLTLTSPSNQTLRRSCSHSLLANAQKPGTTGGENHLLRQNFSHGDDRRVLLRGHRGESPCLAGKCHRKAGNHTIPNACICRYRLDTCLQWLKVASKLSVSSDLTHRPTSCPSVVRTGV